MEAFTFETTIPKTSRHREEAERLWREIETGKKPDAPSIAYIVAKLYGRRNTEEDFMKGLRWWHEYVVA